MEGENLLGVRCHEHLAYQMYITRVRKGNLFIKEKAIC